MGRGERGRAKYTQRNGKREKIDRQKEIWARAEEREEEGNLNRKME